MASGTSRGLPLFIPDHSRSSQTWVYDLTSDCALKAE